MIKTSLTILLMGLSAVSVYSQDAVQEPQYAYQYFSLNDGKMQPLERQNIKVEAHSQNRFVTHKGTVAEVVEGTESPVKLPAGSHFVVKMEVGDLDPSTLIFLKKFKVGKSDREIPMQSSTHVIFAGKVKSQGTDYDTVTVTVKKYGAKSFEITPSQPLAPGEYVFVRSASGMGSSQVDCFSVAAQ